MVTSRTQTQVAFDGVRISWPVVAPLETNATSSISKPLSIDGIRWGRPAIHSRIEKRMSGQVLSDVVHSSHEVASSLNRWIRSMDGVRLQPRLNA